MGNILKMEKSSKSIDYQESHASLKQLLKERKYRDLWRFAYASRNAHIQLQQVANHKEYDLIIDEVISLEEKHEHLFDSYNSFDMSDGIKATLKFNFGLVYAFHKKNYSDGFIDIRIDNQLSIFNKIIESLDSKQIDIIRRLHELTYQYGFLITELWLDLESSERYIHTFTELNQDISSKALYFPNFTFIKKGIFLEGIQISISSFNSEINDDWDLAIFYTKGDIISHIKSKIDNVWCLKEQQIIGDKTNHLIGLYIDRDACKKSHVLSVLELQISQLDSYYNNPIAILNSEENLALGPEQRSSRRKSLSSQYSSTIDALRLSEGLISKRWNIDKNNTRRAIGLYLWDKINAFTPKYTKGNKKLINEVIDRLKANAPHTLELYLSNYNKYIPPEKNQKFGDLAESHQTVVREMEADYDLAAHCIEKSEFITPYQYKKSRKKKST